LNASIDRCIFWSTLFLMSATLILNLQTWVFTGDSGASREAFRQPRGA
jgi:hypothetical protein